MRCTIPGVNFKVLGKAFTTMSKFGDELFVQPQSDGIIFMTTSPTRSAFVKFKFSSQFFLQYNLHGSSTDDSVTPTRQNQSLSDIQETSTSKVSMKSVLAVFRTPPNAVEHCQLVLDSPPRQLVFVLRCKHSIRKTHYIHVLEGEELNAVYNRDSVANKFCTHSRVLSDVMQNFQKHVEDISLTVSQEKISIRNYIDSTSECRKTIVRTEVSIEPMEFDTITVGTNTTITINSNELRATLFFAESTGIPVMAHFDTPGRPLVLTVSGGPSFEATFVLATLVNQDNDSQASSQASTSVSTTPVRPRKRPATNIIGDQSVDLETATSVEVENAEANTDQHFMEQQQQQPVDTIQRPETPPWLRAHQFYFPHCFRDTQTSSSPHNQEVLCPDSDREDL